MRGPRHHPQPTQWDWRGPYTLDDLEAELRRLQRLPRYTSPDRRLITDRQWAHLVATTLAIRRRQRLEMIFRISQGKTPNKDPWPTPTRPQDNR